MTRLFDDPAKFMDDMLEGFVNAHSELVFRVPGGVVRSRQPKAGKVAVVVGGGCGHYPAFAGLVGSGFADGAIVGNIFTSPSAADAYSVGSSVHAGGGVVITAGNYAGDVMHFTEAARKLTVEGIATQVLFVTDDIASAGIDEIEKRRGIAGNFFVFKALSAAAEEGKSLAEVVAVGKKANELTRTLGVAFSGCTLPGSLNPLFEVAANTMAIGLGIHGEPGIGEAPLPTASDLAKTLVSGVTKELELHPGDKIAVILNGLGSTKYEELFVVWKSVSKLLTDLGVQLVEPEVGELVTSLDMAGCSLTITKLDDELERLWRAGSNTPAYRKKGGSGETGPLRVSSSRAVSSSPFKAQGFPPATKRANEVALAVSQALRAIQRVLLENEVRLGELDAIAGDGDHGRGMVKGILAAVVAATAAADAGAGVGSLLRASGAEWAAVAGGTSGALWGAALKSIGEHLGDDFEELPSEKILSAMQSGYASIRELGGARPGDKTMLDAFEPFLDSLARHLASGQSLQYSWQLAATSANDAAEATRGMTPRIGRARPLAEKSKGNPDPGAISLALCLEAVGASLAEGSRS
jgi:dihydroxyacetone kinase